MNIQQQMIAVVALCASALPLPAAAEDPKATAIAEAALEKMGGQAAWESTRHITWNFFGRRTHVWDKTTGDVRIEGTDRETEEPYLILMNIHTKKGRAWKNAVEVEDEETLATMLNDGEGAWINDSYWLIMPYKLQDPGVTLRSIGERSMLDKRLADVLELTFENVGRTPENRYEVYVARDTGLVEQWDFFAEAADQEAAFQIPWHDWKMTGSIMLSGDRGDYHLTDIAVFDELPRSVYESSKPVEFRSP